MRASGRVDWRVVAWMAPPSIVGAVVGALVADDVSESLLYAAIAAVLVWSGVDLALRPVRPLTRERLRLWPAVAGGVGIGALGGAVGVILGTLRMPTLVRLVGMDVKRAAGTNLVVGFLLGVAGLRGACRLAAASTGRCSLAGLAGAIPGGWLGARATGKIDENVLRIALGVILVLVGAVFAAQARRLAGRDRGDRLGELTRRRVARERLTAPARSARTRSAGCVAMAITRIEGKTVRRSLTKPTPCLSTSTTTILMSREPEAARAKVWSRSACATTRARVPARAD